MLFYGNPTGNPAVHEAMRRGDIGFIDTPNQQNYRPPGVRWCADNGCYGKGFDERRWWRWLQDNAGDPLCAFATAPDVVGDAAATWERSAPWLPRIRGLGYRAAYVAQDGIEDLGVPWEAFDVLFIGGTTRWKLGADVRQLVAAAHRRNVHVHAGRVNTARRYRYMAAIGCHSCDGTALTFGPDANLPIILGASRRHQEQPPLFDMKDHL
jgi:hypothetical protein